MGRCDTSASASAGIGIGADTAGTGSGTTGSCVAGVGSTSSAHVLF